MSWIDPNFPRTATPTDLVGRVLGLNPGMMTGPGTNTYLIGRREPILLDTGAGVPDYVALLEAYLRERGWGRPSRVVLTHRHRDHLGGVAALRERFPGLRVSKMRHRDPDDLPESIEDLRDGQVVQGDGATLVPVYTPGHASDHLCYYLPEEKAVFTGDVVLGGSTTVIPSEDGDLLDYMNSLRRLLGLDIVRIYPAHGPVIEDAKGRIEEYIEHRLMRERQILDALWAGTTTIPDLVRAVYADTIPPALHQMAGQSVASHLKKLAREGRAREEVVPDAPSRWSLIG
ncbi:MAG: beta-lactamase-like protein 2 [Candidatus Rokubacteria bacterium]|nr:beta-lactamase-like protein 2 [Candidatus Rokubacteria bacterium]MBI3826754.1 beta-lactamase-like protein 2 [Candidatus Rokubacteria bacterium]